MLFVDDETLVQTWTRKFYFWVDENFKFNDFCKNFKF